jgi:hypothetical protein
MTNPTAKERARVARASGRSGFRRSININRALAPIDLLIDLMAFLLSPLGWALKEMRQRIGALLARKLAAQLRRTLAHAGIPIPELCDVELIFWVSRTKPLARARPYAADDAPGAVAARARASTPRPAQAHNHPNTEHRASLARRDGRGAERLTMKRPRTAARNPGPRTRPPHLARRAATLRLRARGPPWIIQNQTQKPPWPPPSAAAGATPTTLRLTWN